MTLHKLPLCFLPVILSGIFCEVMEHIPYPIAVPLTSTLLLFYAYDGLSSEATSSASPIRNFTAVMALFTCVYLYLTSSSLHFFNNVTLSSLYKAMYLLAGVLLILTWKKSVIFALPIFLTLMAYKADIGRSVGHPVSGTDWKIIAELPVLLIVTLTMLNSRYGALIRVSKKESVLFAILSAFSLHFANYLYAGLSKLLVAGFNWISNPTLNILRASVVLEQNPVLNIVLSHEGLSGVIRILEPFITSANVLVLALQLLCVIGLFYWRTLIYWLILFDFLHIAIFISSGIFFYKWIVLNVALILLAPVLISAEKDASFRRTQAACDSDLHVFKGYAAVFCLISGVLFYVPWLGWLDGQVVPRVSVKLLDASGAETEVPSNFFLAQSVNFGQHRIPGVSTVPYRAYGAVRSETEFWKCEGQPSFFNAVDLDLAREYFQEVLSALRRVDAAEGPFNVDFYPHHIWSNLNPNISTSLADGVVAVKFSRELLCVSGAIGSRDVLYSEWYEVRVDKNGS